MNILDITIAVLLIVLFIALLAFNYELFGLDKPFIYLPEYLIILVDILPWILFSLFIIDIYLKYKVYNNLKHFLKSHWLDILMTALFPVFSIFKLLKFGFKIYKAIKLAKISKIGVKMIIGIKKVFKYYR